MSETSYMDDYMKKLDEMESCDLYWKKVKANAKANGHIEPRRSDVVSYGQQVDRQNDVDVDGLVRKFSDYVVPETFTRAIVKYWYGDKLNDMVLTVNSARRGGLKRTQIDHIHHKALQGAIRKRFPETTKSPIQWDHIWRKCTNAANRR
jgi:hypothetical protein